MPRIWTDTIEEHRRAVREATLDTTAALVATRGLRGVTMSQVAQETGIGRATLYKYFSDVEEILVAWHERQIHGHLEELMALADGDRAPGDRLRSVLDTYALIQHEHHGSDLGALLHEGEHVTRAQRHLGGFVTGLIAEGVEVGEIRDDVAPRELAEYCVHALVAARQLRTKAAVHRLVDVTLAGRRA